MAKNGTECQKMLPAHKVLFDYFFFRGIRHPMAFEIPGVDAYTIPVS